MLLFEVEEDRGKSRVVKERLHSSENEKSDKVVSRVTSSAEKPVGTIKAFRTFLFFLWLCIF